MPKKRQQRPPHAASPKHITWGPLANPALRDAILAVVDHQLRDTTPPETRRTYERLVALGDVQRLPQLAEISVADRFGEGPGQLGAAEPHRRGVHNSSAGFAAAKW